MSISQTASDLTGNIQSAGVEKQPGVEHLRCKAQAISAAYDFNLAARDFMLADGAIESVVKAIPWSALINPSQEIERRFPLHAEVSVRHLSMAAEAKARRHQSGSGGSGDAAGVATGDDEEVELLAAAASYFSSRVFCLV
jgi:hypothetical protein